MKKDLPAPKKKKRSRGTEFREGGRRGTSPRRKVLEGERIAKGDLTRNLGLPGDNKNRRIENVSGGNLKVEIRAKKP